MSRVCQICGKHPSVGNRIIRHGLAKCKGGIGLHTTGITRRRFLPNLQRVHVKLPNGTTTHMRICTRCLKQGLVTKA
ncbi:MAG: 50S ribosomal protein L28 [Kiritimatiellae bacterium]|nr:50S ribosomal protein L28 [Kiritimatiellia bacterium]MBR4171434.1 50S ribosomal protein L28 [Kiritimatiellia bacterium]